MATIIIETGAGGNPDANSYITEAQLNTYASDRGITLIGEPSVLIIRAMDYAESRQFTGERTNKDQPLCWPRKGVIIDRRKVASDEIPDALVNAVLVTAVAISEGRDPLAPIEAGIKAEKVDVLSVEYQDGTASRPIDTALRAAWQRVGAITQGGLNQINVRRG